MRTSIFIRLNSVVMYHNSFDPENSVESTYFLWRYEKNALFKNFIIIRQIVLNMTTNLYILSDQTSDVYPLRGDSLVEF